MNHENMTDRGSVGGSSFPANIEDFEALLKELRLKKLVIYGQCNGEVDFDDLWWPLVEPLLSSGVIAPTFTLVHDYPAAGGRETTEVYFLKSAVIIRKVWHPYPGYGWSETLVSLWMRPVKSTPVP